MVVATLYLLKYNNYYNRIVKQEENLSAYQQYSLGNPIQGVNFIPNDFVNTTQIVNWSGENPDYMVVVDENQKINSRWFVVNTTRTREGQLRLTLHRDLMIDYYGSVVNQPMFIERGTPISISDPALFKKENTFNQIKQSETLLKDETGCAWIVGYVPRGYDFGNQPIEAKVVSEGGANIIVDNLEDYEFYLYSLGNRNFLANPTEKNYSITMGYAGKSYGTSVYNKIVHTFNQNLETVSTNITAISLTEYNGIALKIQNSTNLYGVDWNAINRGYATSIVEMNSVFNANLASPKPTPQSYTDEFLEQDGYVIQANGIFYDVTLNSEGSMLYSNLITTGNLYNYLSQNLVRTLPMSLSNDSVTIVGTPGSGTFIINAAGEQYSMAITQSGTTAQVTISDDRYHVPEQSFDIFCLPYSDDLIIHNGSVSFTTKSNVALNIATQIVSQEGLGTVYDVQLLPYCPVRYCIKSDGTFDVSGTKYSYVDEIDSQGNKTVGSILLWATTSKFTVPKINVNISGGTTVFGKKFITETQMYRLCSPNYNGMFEFNPALNNGVDYVKVDCTYQPYSPFIRVAINFKGMYGSEFNDSRGLICGGDFSLPQLTDKWADYQLQNKNYQALFDRQIQNMEVSNKIQREREIWGIASGAVGAGVSGAITGAMTAGPWGALTGIATGAFSIGGGIRDLQLSDRLRREGIDFSQDTFRMNLENIQALPQGLSKTNPFSINNKIFPFIEKYECTQIEKQALIMQLDYRGMEVNRISVISNFLNKNDENYDPTIGSYIKARLIKVGNIDEDYHVVSSLAEELYKGVYIQ